MHQWKELACVKLDKVGGLGGLDELAKPDLLGDISVLAVGHGK